MKHIPVVILTNIGSIENMEDAKYHRAYRFLIKSNIIPEEIIQTTTDAIASVSPNKAIKAD